MKFYCADAYQDKCQKLFELYSYIIRDLAPTANIEHIGSSSIPHAISKGDLDIFVGVSPEIFESTITSLVQLDFREKLDTLRTNELCMLEKVGESGIAIQIVANGSEYEDFLTFRDQLRKHITLVRQYNNLKRACRGLKHTEYRKKKSLFIERVLKRAKV
ncbi:GrpB family protein [Vibrio marisflavi]|uniref:GrpB family protein n=1 Tax=Vibrio marisflavi CECT 7928 TaxID=634439 RepID=A0ABN8E1E0_9VIBR|nr:GrpB family protein [Vibrio marisflavi]CAH0536642.1 hypothetical protein VMF7928_00596 [Vibrio marisflavi CECT 7928]